MDLKVSSTTFSGKKEILYGLKKASMLAQTIEFSKIAYKGSEAKGGWLATAAITSYLDMVTKDDKFSNVAKILTHKELQTIKENLTELQTQHGKTKPYVLFKFALERVIKKERHNHPAKRIAANELLELLA